MLSEWLPRPSGGQNRSLGPPGSLTHITGSTAPYSRSGNSILTRRGLWRATMTGGVGNTWGYLLPESEGIIERSQQG